MKKTCKFCQKEFEAIRRQEFCCKTCRSMYYKETGTGSYKYRGTYRKIDDSRLLEKNTNARRLGISYGKYVAGEYLREAGKNRQYC